MNLRQVIQTVRYLKPQQVFYQLKYRVLPSKREIYRPSLITPAGLCPAYSERPFIDSPVADAVAACFEQADDGYQFKFIGLEKRFNNEVDWNYHAYGKLWTYNLNYFEFLFARSCSLDTGLRLIKNYIANFDTARDGLEPYPISLRIINWIKFISAHRISGQDLVKALHWQCRLLSRNPEYHLLGNHLLENGFALLIGGAFLHHPGYYNQGRYIVMKELGRQLLPDGGHFEQSPMYHQIILHRLLDAINLLRVFRALPGQQTLEEQLCARASQMLAWLGNITFSDGSVPSFNDAAGNIAPSGSRLQAYAAELGVTASGASLRESGYRMWRKGHAELCLDAGNITASYQPGHTHADTFTFCMQAGSVPVIVDTGISTYEKNERRQWERSTAAHNTVTVANRDSSEVWGGFRLGRRAKVRIDEEAPYKLTATHDGYKALGILHQRSFNWEGDHLIIKDKLTGNEVPKEGVSRLHFHPACIVALENGRIRVNEHVLIEPEHLTSMVLENYQYCTGYNQLQPAKRVTGLIERDTAVWKISFR